MPNGGPRPDCLHCQHFRDQRTDDERVLSCIRHNTELAFPLYVFCSQYTDRIRHEGIDWLDDEIESRESLRDDMMYVWLGGYEIKFIHVPLAPISEYAHWTQEMFIDKRNALTEKYRDQLNGK